LEAVVTDETTHEAEPKPTTHEAGPKPTPRFWNTGIYKVTNSSGGNLYYFDAEDHGHAGVIGVAGTQLNGLVLPWCGDSKDVRTKAIRIFEGVDATGSLLLWLFQDYRTDVANFIPNPGKAGGGASSPQWTQRQDLGEGATGKLDITISNNQTVTGIAI
jgi:hypothetical protein